MQNYDLTADEAAVFFEEANELLESLDRDLVIIEQQVDDELVHRVFRAVHTLKGAAGTIDHQPMALLAHAAETVLEKVRNHELAVSTGMANLLFQMVEYLRIFLEEIINDTATEIEVNGLIQQLKGLLNGEDGDDGDDGAIPASTLPGLPLMDDISFAVVEEGLRDGLNLLVVFAEADMSGIAPMARLLQMYMQAEQSAQIIVSSPTCDALERGEGNGTLLLAVITDLQRVEFESDLSNIFEIQALQVADLSNASHLLRQQPGEAESGLKRLIGEEGGLVTLPALPEPAGGGEADRHISNNTTPRNNPHSARTVRTSIERLDNLLNLASELVTDRNRLFKIYEDLSALIDGEHLVALNDVITHLSSVTDRTHDEVFKARMQPIEFVFNKFPRFVRQICQDLGKDVDLVIAGLDTEVDRSVIEQVADPILHLVRNAIDHGIETSAERILAGKEAKGRLELSAHSEEGHIVITIADDGQGVNAEKVKRKAVALGLITPEEAERLGYNEAIDLIFAPGLSTAIEVSDLSGRGVGMDVVRNNIQRINGSVAVYSTPDVGTTFELRLPLTLAIIPTLLVEVGEQVYALPLPNVFEIFKLEPGNVQSVRGRETISMRGEVLPLVRLADLFAQNRMAPEMAGMHLGRAGESQDNLMPPSYIVSIAYREIHLGIVVSGLLGKQDVVIKSLGHPINNVRGLTGATLLGDGRIGLIIDVAALVSMSMEMGSKRTPGV